MHKSILNNPKNMKIKAYTDVEQSKRLAEILSLNSADMRYAPFGDTHPWFVKDSLIEKDSIPCWSLAALFEVIPVVIERAGKKYRLRMDKSEEDSDIWYEEIDSGLAQPSLDIIAPNMVDACVAMIIELHNRKLL